MALRMPIGESDFRRLIQGRYYFVDKSLFIKEVLEDSASVILITRPRRFGKTLNLSMMRYFFAKEVDGQPTKGLFEGLKIQQEGEFVPQYQGQYPVIFLTFKDLKFNTFDETYEHFTHLIARLYTEHYYLVKGNVLLEHEKKNYRALLENQANSVVLSDALRGLSEYLHRYHKVPPLILIDEYDTPIQSGYLNGYYPEMVGLFRSFLGAGLKDNPHCFKAVLTGILRVSKESLFSGLNNIRVYSVLQKRYGEYFGFTESEVQQLLESAGLQTQSAAIQSWYNGYQIGIHTLYNPWSLLNCVEETGQLIPYWVNTSDNALVKDGLYQSGLIYQETLEHLLQGETVDCLIQEHMVFSDLKASFKNEDVILSFLLMAGYFKVVSVQNTEYGPQCQLAIPNIEVRGLYSTLIKHWLGAGQNQRAVNQFLDELLRGDLPAFEQSFRFLLENTISVHDLSQEPEAFYHGFMTGLTAHLQSHPDYELKSNRESGYGRYDYFIRSRVPERPSLLMEFKRVRFSDPHKPSLAEIDEALEQAAQQALAQIEEKAYAVSTTSRPPGQHLLKVAIAFCGKRFKLLSTP